MKFSDFHIGRVVEHYSEESLYYNKDNISRLLRTVNYFEAMFVNTSRQNELSQLLWTNGKFSNNILTSKLEDVLSKTLLRRCQAMADYIYDESAWDYKSNKNLKEIDHDKNLKLASIMIAMKLVTFYTSVIVTRIPAPKADKFLTTLYYQIIDHYDAIDIIDEIIYSANESYDKRSLENNKDHECNRYAYDSEREYIFFRAMNRNPLNSYNRDMSKWVSTIMCTDIGRARFDIEQHRPSKVVHDIIQKAIVDINGISIDLETKNRMLGTLNTLFNESIFDEQKEFELIRSALVYNNNRRPTIKCNELFDKHKEKYGYKGIVYHGFRTHNIYGHQVFPKNLLKEYHDGFISCSKDLSIAASFAETADGDEDFSERDRMCVLEILIDDNVEAIDIERILSDAHEKSPAKYDQLYMSYLREKEVLLKLPMVSYNILTAEEVHKRINPEKENKWRDFKDDIDNNNVINKAKPLQGF